MAAKRNHWQVNNSGTQQCYLFKNTAVTVSARCVFRRQICADTNNAFTALDQQHNMLTECLGWGGGGAETAPQHRKQRGKKKKIRGKNKKKF